jgi:hypothetical protein
MDFNEKQHFDRGMDHLRAGRYEDAIREFRIAKEIFVQRKN